MRNDPVFQSILDGKPAEFSLKLGEQRCDLSKKTKKWVIFGGLGWLFLVVLSGLASLAFFGLSVWVAVFVLQAMGVL